jgi:type II secretory pathway pseudopilin PulG
MKLHTSRLSKLAAISLVEVMVACGLLAITAAAAVGTLIRMNHRAALSRLQTGASTVAQDRIDRILEDGPFDPRKNKIPDVLVVGTQTTGSDTNPTIPIYTDTATNSVVVYGWMTSTVTESVRPYGPWQVMVRTADVTVGYRFRGKPYTVRMCTVRSPDA